MRTPLIRAVALAATLLAPLALHTPLAQVPAAAAGQAAGAGRVIVKLKADSALLRAQAQSLSAAAQKTSRTQALGQRLGVALVAGSFVSERAHVVFARGMTSAELAARLSAQPDVEYAVADGRKRIVAAPNDPFYASRPVGASTRRAGRRPVVPEAAGRRAARPPTPRRRRSTPSRPGTSRPAARASSSPSSTPACASTIPTCRAATCSPATTW